MYFAPVTVADAIPLSPTAPRAPRTSVIDAIAPVAVMLPWLCAYPKLSGAIAILLAIGALTRR